jgi:hypothetical protein
VTIDRVRVGGFFVNEDKGLVREITAETSDDNVHWRSYFLADGCATGDSLMCTKHRIVQWADREATAEEAAKMQRRDAQAAEDARAMWLVNIGLVNASDEQLLAEIRRRGYDVVRR